MRKNKLLIVSMLLLFELLSCGQISDGSPDLDNGDLDGDQHSRVVGTYLFKSFDEYFSFYSVFKKYNNERYWAPFNSNDFDVTYIFKSEGMYLEDAIAKRYDLKFQYQTMLVNINDDDFNLKMNLYALPTLKLLSEDLLLSLGKIFYTPLLNVEFTMLCDGNVIGRGTLVSNLLDEYVNTEILNNVLLLMKEGYNYAF